MTPAPAAKLSGAAQTTPVVAPPAQAPASAPAQAAGPAQAPVQATAQATAQATVSDQGTRPHAPPASAPNQAQTVPGITDVTAPSAPSGLAAAPATPMAAPAMAVAAAPGPAVHGASPAATPNIQIAAGLTGIHIAAGATGQVTIHLQPAELGAVQVRIERAHDGSATVTVQVEKAETLHSMQQDLPHLHQALDRAGLPSEARQVSLHLAPAAGSDTQSGPGGSGEGQRHNTAPRPQQSQQGPAADAPEDPAEPQWRAAGINITA